MSAPRLLRLRRVMQRIQKRLAPKALILMYHRVAEVDQDPWSLCVTPQCFTQQLVALQNHAQPVSLRQLAQAHQDGNIPHRAVAVTFDDGYADNLYEAKPLLEKYGIPATFFVSTGYLGKNREFWWDELERLLLCPGKLPDRLLLDINGVIHDWELGPAADYTQAQYQRDCTFKVKAWKAQPASRLAFYESVWQVLRPCQEQIRTKLLDELIIWANAQSTARKTHRSLLPEEVYLLGRGELLEIGAHTVTHPFLSAQSVIAQQHEMQQSKAELEEILQYSVTNFSYPFGDCNAETVKLVQSSGFDSACSTIGDVVWKKSDRFQLPRYGVENWSGAEFIDQLSRWFYV
jgi:peptidoglycan/xylan/chitin deacetylase (PgdA/CDA1 family)